MADLMGLEDTITMELIMEIMEQDIMQIMEQVTMLTMEQDIMEIMDTMQPPTTQSVWAAPTRWAG